VLPAIAFSGVFYGMMGLEKEVLPFLRHLGAAALASADSALVCTAISAIFPTQPGAASLVATVILLLFLLVGGFNLNLGQLPDWVEWIATASFARHAFETMICSELDGQMVRVEVPGAPAVDLKAGVILKAMGLSPDNYAWNFGCLAIFLALTMAATTLVVMYQMGAVNLRSLCRPAAGSVSGNPRRQAATFRARSIVTLLERFSIHRSSSFLKKLGISSPSDTNVKAVDVVKLGGIEEVLSPAKPSGTPPPLDSTENTAAAVDCIEVDLDSSEQQPEGGDGVSYEVQI
jgi:hypothetical protein